MYSLYFSPGAASLLVHWILLETGEAHDLKIVDTKGGEQKSPAYLKLNPNGMVPTLIDLDGTPRFEAAALAMTLADRHGLGVLAPAHDHPQRADYYQWMFHLANVLQPLFRTWWYPQEAAGPEQADRAVETVRPRIEAVWDRLDAHLRAQSGPYLLGEHLSVADFYLVMLMRWSRNMPRPAQEWPHLAALAQRLKARPSFKRLYEREGLTDWT